jgi:hypothetical protein
MRTIELGVTITDAALDEKQTTIFCSPVARDPKYMTVDNPRCPDCGREGRYRDTVIRPLTDLPVAGYPWVLRVAVPRYRCLTPECARAGLLPGSGQAGGSAGLDDTAVCPVCVAAVDDRPSPARTHRRHHHASNGPIAFLPRRRFGYVTAPNVLAPDRTRHRRKRIE